MRVKNKFFPEDNHHKIKDKLTIWGKAPCIFKLALEERDEFRMRFSRYPLTSRMNGPQSQSEAGSERNNPVQPFVVLHFIATWRTGIQTTFHYNNSQNMSRY
jgi:hypothetical protein